MWRFWQTGQRPGDGGYTEYAGNGHREGESDNVEVLADWAASWRRRVTSAELPAEARHGGAPPRVGGANLPVDGGGPAALN
jgi:hypothetical protein